MEQPIYFFTKTDPYFELSNFYPQGFEEDGKYWPSVEHYFQAQKFTNEEYKEKIRNTPDPKTAANLGRSRKIKLRDDWEHVKDDVMRKAVRTKFQSHPELRELLMSTHNEKIIENAPGDYYWGCGKDGTGKTTRTI